MVDSSKQVNAKLHKLHTLLSIHHVREFIASKMVRFYFILGESHPADSELDNIKGTVVLDRRYN
jgi:hypothetical protein